MELPNIYILKFHNLLYGNVSNLHRHMQIEKNTEKSPDFITRMAKGDILKKY